MKIKAGNYYYCGTNIYNNNDDHIIFKRGNKYKLVKKDNVFLNFENEQGEISWFTIESINGEKFFSDNFRIEKIERILEDD